MTYQEQVDQFYKTCQGLIREMADWFHGLTTPDQTVYTPDEAFKEQMRQQAKTLEEQLQLAKRAIQDGRRAHELLGDPFITTFLDTFDAAEREMAVKVVDGAKSMEDVAYARGWRVGHRAFRETLEHVVKLGKGAEKTLVDLTKPTSHKGGPT